MMNAYSSLYLETAQKTLGGMLHYAVYDLKWSIDDFFRAFINSGIAYRFGIGEPKYTVGMSGPEVAMDVVYRVTGEYPDILPSYYFDRTPEYWAGWAVAYYEWARDIPFDKIEEYVGINKIVEMYHPYHEADISKLVDIMDERIESMRKESTLKRLRKYANLTQKALAERSGVSVRMIEQYEQGTKELSRASAFTVRQLSKALNCRMEDLMG